MGTINEKYTILDNYKQKELDISYDRDIPKYPKRARRALPILIERTKKDCKKAYIGYTELADLLGIKPYRSRALHMGSQVCACISTTLYRLEQRTCKKLPRLTNIVFTPDSLLNENNYVVNGLRRLGFEPTWKNYKCQLLKPILAYDQWDTVLDLLSITAEERTGGQT